MKEEKFDKQYNVQTKNDTKLLLSIRIHSSFFIVDINVSNNDGQASVKYYGNSTFLV